MSKVLDFSRNGRPIKSVVDQLRERRTQRMTRIVAAEVRERQDKTAQNEYYDRRDRLAWAAGRLSVVR